LACPTWTDKLNRMESPTAWAEPSNDLWISRWKWEKIERNRDLQLTNEAKWNNRSDGFESQETHENLTSRICEGASRWIRSFEQSITENYFKYVLEHYNQE
jgi:hypothetical protein